MTPWNRGENYRSRASLLNDMRILEGDSGVIVVIKESRLVDGGIELISSLITVEKGSWASIEGKHYC